MIGKSIQEKRKALGLTQSQLAELLGVTAPAVNRWEKDLSYPDANLLAPLARALKTDLNALFSFYDSLSDKERELVVDHARNMLLTSTDAEALSYIEETLKSNLSDGLLFKDMAGMLHGMHFFREAADPCIYLDKIAAYYERALILLPEQRDSIAYSLMSVYAELGEIEKAEEAFSLISDAKINKAWAYIELLYSVQRYDEAIPAIKQSILRCAVDLSSKLDLLRDAYKKINENKLSDMAGEKSEQLRSLFGFWTGFSLMSDLTNSIASQDVDLETAKLKEFVNLDTRGKGLSDDPLFKEVSLGGILKESASTADLMADIMVALKKKQEK